MQVERFQIGSLINEGSFLGKSSLATFSDVMAATTRSTTTGQPGCYVLLGNQTSTNHEREPIKKKMPTGDPSRQFTTIQKRRLNAGIHS